MVGPSAKHAVLTASFMAAARCRRLLRCYKPYTTNSALAILVEPSLSSQASPNLLLFTFYLSCPQRTPGVFLFVSRVHLLRLCFPSLRLDDLSKKEHLFSLFRHLLLYFDLHHSLSPNSLSDRSNVGLSRRGGHAERFDRPRGLVLRPTSER